VRNDSPQVAAKIRHNYEFLIKLTVASLSLGTTLAHILKRGTAFCARIAEEIWLATPCKRGCNSNGLVGPNSPIRERSRRTIA